jgi:molybdenum cofactor biosynthesis enzyme MoaA
MNSNKADILYDKEEKMKILKAGLQKNWGRNIMNVFLAPNNTCNFLCSYCVNAGSRRDKSKFISEATLKLFFSKLIDLKKEKYFFAISGGEPLIYPHLETMFDMIENEFDGVNTIIFSTNGYFLNNKQKVFEKIQNTKLTITLSAHIEQISIDNYKEILSNSSLNSSIFLPVF